MVIVDACQADATLKVRLLGYTGRCPCMPVHVHAQVWPKIQCERMASRAHAQPPRTCALRNSTRILWTSSSADLMTLSVSISSKMTGSSSARCDEIRPPERTPLPTSHRPLIARWTNIHSSQYICESPRHVQQCEAGFGCDTMTPPLSRCPSVTCCCS